MIMIIIIINNNIKMINTKSKLSSRLMALFSDSKTNNSNNS